MQNRNARAIAADKTQSQNRVRQWMFGSLLLVGGGLLAGAVFADGHEGVTKTYGFNEYDELKYPADFAHLDYVNPDAPKGGEMSISWSGTFDSLNPYATLTGTPAVMSNVMYESLMTSTADEIGSLYCLLCETIEFPEDKSWLIFNLRKDVTFSDGTPMTSADVIHTHELFREQGTPSYRASIVDLIPEYEAIDDYTVKFTFNPDSPVRGRIGQMGGAIVMQKKWFEETGARLDGSRMENAPGTGEYMFGPFDPGRQITYLRNPDYWGDDVPIQVGRGNYDSIRIEYFADTSAAFEGFKAGEFTFRAENSSLNWATAYDFPALEKEFVVRDTVPRGTLPGATGFVFNMLDGKSLDRRVRQALGLMYNFTWTNNNLQYGLFQQRVSFWDNERLAATGLPEGRELELLETVRDMIPEVIFTEPPLMPHESGDQPLDRRNLRRALALMEEAGYTPDDEGMLRNADGDLLSIEFLETRQSFDRILQPYVENVKRLGVDFTYNRVDPAQYQARVQDKDFDVYFSGYSVGLLEGRGLSQKFGCEDREDVFNRAGYCNPAVDALSKYVEAAETYDEMAAAISAIDRIMRYDYFVVPVWTLRESWLAYYDMYEYPENLPEFSTGEMDFWWINQEKADALRAAGAFQ